MKILLLSPVDPDAVGGNATTLRRLRDALRARGVDVLLQPVEADAPAQVRRERPDLVHAYHGWKTGRVLPDLPGVPSVLTLSGTDLNEPDRRDAVERAIAAARMVLTYSPSIAARVPRARLIPKGVALGTGSCDLRAAAGLPPDARVLLFPGGLREVKDPLFAVEATAPLAAARPGLALVLAGPLLDPALGQKLPEAPWLRRVLVPPDAMPDALRQAEVVVNTSRSEGLSNALMEAMSVGSAVLASDIPGNRDLIRDGVTGLLYRGVEAYRASLGRLLDDASLRGRLGRAASEEAATRFSTKAEADAVLAAYETALRTV